VYKKTIGIQTDVITEKKGGII